MADLQTILEVSAFFSRIAIIMITVERELESVLTLLRNKIRERGFTQLEVQEALGWGRSYISQLLTKQKSLRIEQVLLILNVIGVDPSEFFGELYHFPASGAGYEDPRRYPRYPARVERFEPAAVTTVGGGESEELQHNFQELRSLLRGLLRLLSDKGLLQADELDSAVTAAKSGGMDDF